MVAEPPGAGLRRVGRRRIALWNDATPSFDTERTSRLNVGLEGYSHTPIQRIVTQRHMAVKRRPGPVGNLLYPSVFDRVPVQVVQVVTTIGLVAHFTVPYVRNCLVRRLSRQA